MYSAQCYVIHIWMTFRQTKVNVVSTLVNCMEDCSDVCSLIVFNGQEGLHIHKAIHCVALTLWNVSFFFSYIFIISLINMFFYPCVLNLPFPGLYQIRDGRILRNKIHLAVHERFQTLDFVIHISVLVFCELMCE